MHRIPEHKMEICICHRHTTAAAEKRNSLPTNRISIDVVLLTEQGSYSPHMGVAGLLTNGNLRIPRKIHKAGKRVSSQLQFIGLRTCWAQSIA